MKITVLLLLCLALCGCGRQPVQHYAEVSIINTPLKIPDIARVTLDGHVYYLTVNSEGTLIHSEGCTNVIHGPDVWRNIGPRYPEPSFPLVPQFPKGYIENPELAPRFQTLEGYEPTKPTRKEK